MVSKQLDTAIVKENFFDGVTAEIKRISWPSRDTVIKATTLVIMIVVVSTIYVGGLDLVFSKVILRLKSL
jgi:preprotein translocase subunit SecE